MGSTILKIAIFVIAVVSGAIFFFAKPNSTESNADNVLASKTVSNATQPAAQLTTTQPQPAPTFQWDNSDDLPAEDGPPEAPTSDFSFGANEDVDEVDQTIASFDSDSFNADADAPSMEDNLSATDSSSQDESSSFEDNEPPTAPEPDTDFAEENALLSDDSTAEQEFVSESNSPNSDPHENDSFENEPMEVDNEPMEVDDLSESESFSMNKQDDDEFDSFSTDDSPTDTNQNTFSSAEPDSTPGDLDDTTNLNSDQFSNTENSNFENSERSLEDTSELLEEPQNVPETAEPIETPTSELQLDSQADSSFEPDTSLPSEVATNETSQPTPSQNDSQAVTDGPTHRIAMEQDAVLGRSGIVNNDSLSGGPGNHSSAVPVPTPVTQTNPAPLDVPMPATTDPMETDTEVVDAPKQFSGECFQPEIEEFGSQLFWPSTSKLITEADTGNALAPVNQPINEPVDQTAGQPTRDELINFGPHEPGIIFDTDTSGDCAQPPAPTMTTKPDTSTPLLAPDPSTSTSPAPSTWTPCSPESAPRVRYIWIIPKCECKKPPKCCGK